jgi:hypothetical protein
MLASPLWGGQSLAGDGAEGVGGFDLVSWPTVDLSTAQARRKRRSGTAPNQHMYTPNFFCRRALNSCMQWT